MPESIPPPLSVFNTGSTPLIPAFELEMSGGTVTRLNSIRVQYVPPGVNAAPVSRAINTTAPLAGGGDLSVDRTHTVDTAAVVTSGRTISTLFPLAGGGDLSANRTVSVNTAFLVTTARTISAGAGLSGGGDLSADRTISLATPVVVSSGGTGATTFTAFGVLYGSGGSAIQAVAAMNSGQLLVGSSTTTRPAIVGPGAEGQMLLASGGVVGGLVFIGTAAAGAAAPTYPIIVASGGTGQTSLTNRGVLIGSGTNAVQALSAMARGQLMVGTNAVFAPTLLSIGSQGQVLRVDTAADIGLVWGYGDISARAFNSANISCANASFTILGMDSERFDTDSIHSTVTNTSRLTATTAGKYFIAGCVFWDANATGERRLAIFLNAGTNLAVVADVNAGSGINLSQTISTYYSLAANDYVELRVYQDAGVSINVQAQTQYSPEFMMVKVP